MAVRVTFPSSQFWVWLLFKSKMGILCLFTDTATTEIYTLSLHDALPISVKLHEGFAARGDRNVEVLIAGNGPLDVVHLVVRILHVIVEADGLEVRAFVRHLSFDGGDDRSIVHSFDDVADFCRRLFSARVENIHGNHIVAVPVLVRNVSGEHALVADAEDETVLCGGRTALHELALLSFEAGVASS